MGPLRNRLDSRALADMLALWVESAAEVRIATAGIPQGAVVLRGRDDAPLRGSFVFAAKSATLGLYAQTREISQTHCFNQFSAIKGRLPRCRARCS